MKKIVVTGATGLIGSYLVMRLLRSGDCEVTAVASSERSFGKLDGLLGRYGMTDGHSYRREVADLSDFADCRRMLRSIEGGADVIYHCAAKVAVGNLKKVNGEMLVRDNVGITHNMVAVASEQAGDTKTGKKGKPLFVHVSSVSALGNGLNERGMADENSIMENLIGVTSYGRSKFLSENEVWRGEAHGLPVVIVNPGVVLGAMVPEAGFWLRKLMLAIKRGLSVWVEGGTSFVGVEDLVRAMIMLTETPDTWGRRYVLSAGNLSYREFLTGIGKAVGRKHSKPWLKIATGLLRFGGLFVPNLSAVAKNAENPKRFDGSGITQVIPFKYQDWEGMWSEIVAFDGKI